MTERWTPPTEPVPPGWSPRQPPAEPPPPQQGWGGQPQWTTAQAPKPGIIPLRPLGVGEILDGAISGIRSQPRVMLGLSLVVAVITQVISVPLTWLLLRDTADVAFQVDQPASTDGQLAFAASAISATGIQVVVTLVALLMLTGMLTVVVSRAVLGERITTRAAWQRTRPRVPALIGVMVTVSLISVGVLAAGIGPGVVLAVASAPAALTVLAFVLGIPAALVAVVYLYVAFALAPSIVVLERARVVAALRRSRALVRGGWWRTFGILFLVNLIAQFMASILAIPFTVLSMVAAFLSDSGDVNPYAIVPLLLSAVGTILASAITWPFTAVATTLLYVDRRMRREGLDIELARVAAATAARGGPEPAR